MRYIYGAIYFPTFTNGLKDIANYLGFAWSISKLSGEASHVIRFQWEITKAPNLKEALTVYNIEDCRAAEVVLKALFSSESSDVYESCVSRTFGADTN